MKYFSTLIFIFQFNTFLYSQNWDIELLRDINLERNKSHDGFYKGLSNTATPVNIGVPLILYSISQIKKNKELKNNSLYLAGSTLTGFLFANGMKVIVKRPRPYVTYPDIDNVTLYKSFSFPSSHTATTFSLATSLSLSYPKWYIIAPSFLWAGSVSYSRMHLGVHYPGDVIGGIVVGSGSALLCHYLNKKWFVKTKTKLK